MSGIVTRNVEDSDCICGIHIENVVLTCMIIHIML
jgi:hypothetical protein